MPARKADTVGVSAIVALKGHSVRRKERTQDCVESVVCDSA